MKSPNTEPGLLGNVFTAILACVLSNSPNISKDHPWWLLFSPPCLCLTWVISVLYHRSCSIGLVQGMFYRKLPFTWKTMVSLLDFSLQTSDGWFSHWSLLGKLLWTKSFPPWWPGAVHGTGREVRCAASVWKMRTPVSSIYAAAAWHVVRFLSRGGIRDF